MITVFDHQHEKWIKRITRWTKECVVGATLCFRTATPSGASRLYDEVFGSANILAENSLFANLGYWANRPATLDAACVELARLIGREAQLQPGDSVVDVGSGFGDSDFLWATEFHVTKITGVNVSRKQIEIASARAQSLGVAEGIQFVYGSALDLPSADASADKMIALESAFHFPSRKQFFSEAFRVLKPGGTLATADITLLPRGAVPQSSFLQRTIGANIARSVMPHKANRVNAFEYQNLLQQAGYENIKVYSIRDDVYEPLARHWRDRFHAADQRINPFMRFLYGPRGLPMWSPWLDYIIATAQKPQIKLNK